MAELKNTLNQAVKDAMKAKDKNRLTTLRMATSAIKQIEVDEKIEVDDTRVLAVLEKMIKQRKDAATQYKDGGRDELAAKEEAEITVLQDFLPTQLSAEELAQLVDEAIQSVGAESMKDMGKVMAEVKPKVQGRADMSQVSQSVKAKLG